MENIFTAKLDIENRIGEDASNRTVSNMFLKQLLHILDTFDDDVSTLCVELRNLLSDDAWNLDVIRWELARTPASFKVVKTSRITLNGRHERYVGLKRGDYSIPLGSKYMPDSVRSLDEYQEGSPIWCFCSKEQVQYFRLPDMPCWHETDSLVDWICDYVTIQAGESSIQRETLTKKERIYRYIKANATANSPVKTRDILALENISESYTFDALRKLEREGKIECISQGLYIAL